MQRRFTSARISTATVSRMMPGSCFAQRGTDGGFSSGFREEETGTPVLQLLEEQHDSAPQNHGISLVRPGQYETACGKGYWECGPGEPEVLKLRRPAVEFFKFESASSIFFWDVKTNGFHQVAWQTACSLSDILTFSEV